MTEADSPVRTDAASGMAGMRIGIEAARGDRFTRTVVRYMHAAP
jgi:hypothetical protein